MKRFLGFLKKTDGLTTIEWVMLAAVVMAAAFGISNMVMLGANDLGTSVADQMSEAADN
jgi:hypothetical protein